MRNRLAGTDVKAARRAPFPVNELSKGILEKTVNNIRDTGSGLRAKLYDYVQGYQISST